MKIAIGNDHCGVKLKTALIKYLEERGIEVINLGTDEEESVNYPVYALKVAKSIISGESDRGILICGTGIGISISANKVPGIRCACCSEPFSAEMASAHNNANILAFGARVVDEKRMLELVKAYLDTPFMGGRHQNRIDRIADIENEYMK